MRNLFIAVVLAGSLMACTLYFGDDPTPTSPEDQSADLYGRGHGHHHRDAGTDGAPEIDAGFFPDGAPSSDAGVSFPDGAPGGDAGVFPDGAPPGPDAGVFPDGRPY